MKSTSLAADYELEADWEHAPSEFARRAIADVAVDSSDRVYVLTRDEGRVCVYNRDGSFVKSWTHERVGPGAHGISVDRLSFVYVVDSLEHCVTKFSNDGEIVFILGRPGQAADNGIEPWPPKTLTYPVEWHSALHSTSPFNGCTKVAFGPSGELFVSDGYGNARIHHFSQDGELVESWGNPGSGSGEFHNPHGIHVGPDDLMYVSDRENDRVQVFTLQFEFVRELKVQRPAASAVDAAGRLAVASLRYQVGEDTFTRGRVQEPVPDRFSVFDAAGKQLFEVEDGIHVPNGLAIDSHGDVYIAQVGKFHQLNATSADGHAQRAERPEPPSGLPSVSKFLRKE